ncbi:Protein root UVB sensitive 4 [Camellia lanceoleosa]|uniref:Protein root UVB sensitive 4 n=1 Tax=Camellia lanceoleosa TaxID=1840588 RepID=A0ACC0J592_9ERIC|nr:Protein root UVB sensitive 4 [Camellia lanceoleosa]
MGETGKRYRSHRDNDGDRKNQKRRGNDRDDKGGCSKGRTILQGFRSIHKKLSRQVTISVDALLEILQRSAEEKVRVFSSALQVLATQAMFRAIGIGYSHSLPSAAALNWVLKDGLGRLSRCIYTTSLASSFSCYLMI